MLLWNTLPLACRLSVSQEAVTKFFDAVNADSARLANLILDYVRSYHPTNALMLNNIMIMCGIANRF